MVEILFRFTLIIFSDIEWKVTYVGCANDPTQDQVLEEVLVGPVSMGINNFVLTAPAPDFSIIPVGDLIGVTVLLISCSYLEQEFVKIGYYVNNEYNDPTAAASVQEGEPVPIVIPAQIEIQNMYRNILADKPIVTRINIDWSGNGGMEVPPPQSEDGENDQEVEVYSTPTSSSAISSAENQTILLEEDSMDVERMQANLRRIS
jgi:histone chaperone ASF1